MISHKRTRRLYREQELTLRRRRRRRPVERERRALTQPIEPNVCWSMDFMHDTLANGRPFRTFNVIDGKRPAPPHSRPRSPEQC